MIELERMTYFEHKECLPYCFSKCEKDPENWKPYNVESWLEEELSDRSELNIMMFLISLCEYEVRNNLLSNRVYANAYYHIYRWEEKEKYKADLTPEEINEIEKDIEYIKTNTVPYFDEEWANRD